MAKMCGNRARFIAVMLAAFTSVLFTTAAWSQATAPAVPGQPVPGGRQFTPGSWSRLDELPSGRLRTRLQGLSPGTRQRALDALRSTHFPEQDLVGESLQLDDEGNVYYADPPPAGPPPEQPQRRLQGSSAQAPAAPVPVSPFPASLVFHSRPGSANKLYLDFDGETVVSTVWNLNLARSAIHATPLDLDNNPATFSDDEQAATKEIWQRVAEDYAPFNIDVTTERPSTLTNTSASRTTGHVVITNSHEANGNPLDSPDAGGVAYVNKFGISGSGSSNNYWYWRPAWVYFDNTSYYAPYIADAVSHEAGHNLGLTHDGNLFGTDAPTKEYYYGHGSGDTSWAPIMGAAYDRDVSQWSKGQYYGANNTQDDLAVIASKLAYRPDDRGNSIAAATPLTLSGATITSTTPNSDPGNLVPANKGVLSTNTDVDVFSLQWTGGRINLNVKPSFIAGPFYDTSAGNLDVLLELRDANGTLLASNNPPTLTNAFVSPALSPGLYYLYVRNTGVGNPLAVTPDGYTSYGSIGQYFVSGDGRPYFSIGDATITEGNSGVRNVTLTVTLDEPRPVETSVSYYMTDGTALSGMASRYSGLTVTTVNDGAPATPYPDTQVVPYLPDLEVAAAEFELITAGYPTQTRAADLDVLLVSPAGHKIMLMSDAGGASPLPSGDIIFRSGEPAMTSAALPPDFYQAFSPTDLEPGENLPLPAPPGPYGTDLSVLNNIDRTGPWRLYVADDATGGLSGGFEWRVVFSFRGNDYDSRSGNLVFPPGVTSQTINVRVVGDTTPEQDEVFFVNLYAADSTSTGINKGQGQVRIINDDQFAGPANDNAGAAQLIGEERVQGTLANATADGGSVCGGNGQRDIWYRFIAPRAGVVKADSCGTNDLGGVDAGVDTVVSIYASPANTELSCNDNWVTAPSVTACLFSDAGNLVDSDTEASVQQGQEILVRVSESASSGADSVVLRMAMLTDSDADAIADYRDNCTLVANRTQLDADHDGYGNICDADLNNSGMVTTGDFALLRSVLNKSASSSPTAAAADLNGSGTVTTADFAILRARLNTAPGPSALVP